MQKMVKVTGITYRGGVFDMPVVLNDPGSVVNQTQNGLETTDLHHFTGGFQEELNSIFN